MVDPGGNTGRHDPTLLGTSIPFEKPGSAPVRNYRCRTLVPSWGGGGIIVLHWLIIPLH